MEHATEDDAKYSSLVKEKYIADEEVNDQTTSVDNPQIHLIIVQHQPVHNNIHMLSLKICCNSSACFFDELED